MAVAEPDPDPSTAERLAELDVWRLFPNAKPAGGPHPPLSADWFKHLESKRYRHHGRWLPTLLEFTRHARESLMAVGDGLGLDWVRFAEGGADMTVVDPSAERLRLYRTHFAARGASTSSCRRYWTTCRRRTAGLTSCVRVFNEPPVVPWANALAEAYRVLRPGGKVMVVLPAKYDAVWWQELFLPWRRWFRKGPRRKGRFTARELREAFAKFQDVRVLKRHLRRSELPYIWRWLPLPVDAAADGAVPGGEGVQAVDRGWGDPEGG